MLETLYYPDNFPIRISVVNLVEDPIHYHTDIEFVYVLKGEIQLKNGYYTYHLHANDIFTNSGHEVHSLKAITPDNIVAQIQVSTRDLSQYFPNLSQACYRTYAKRPAGKKHNRLRELLLQLLLKYEQKDFNYKSECLYLMVDIIKHLEKYFNLFAFDQDMVVGFDRGNALAVERISRICTYIYQNYANNITLQDLSEMEHLSSFYLSHLIKDFTGMSFREFLCFARVEMSEMRLLGSTSKISHIAARVGFSTTAYYKKYFTKWFGHDPHTHRDLYLSEVKSDLKPAVFHPLSPDRSLPVIRSAYSAQSTDWETNRIVSILTLNVKVDPDCKSIQPFGKDFHFIVTPEDFLALGPSLFETLQGLSPAKVILQHDNADPAAIHPLQDLLLTMGFPTECRDDCFREKERFFARDTVLYPIDLISRMVDRLELPTDVYLRDMADGDATPLRGQSAPITVRGFKKPSYYAYSALSRLRGEVIARGSQYCVIRVDRGSYTDFVIFAYNCSNAVRRSCMLSHMDLPETMRIINDYRDELNLGVTLYLKPSTYSVIKYSLNRENNIFAHLAALDFRCDALSSTPGLSHISDTPTMETYMEDVRTELNLNFSLKGPSIQMALIHPCLLK